MTDPNNKGLVDKSAVGIGERQFHIKVAPGEVSTIALLPGDPFRVPLIAEFLTDVREIAHNREHRTMTGMYKGKKITATSTGMGCPSTAIAVEELARVGVPSHHHRARPMRARDCRKRRKIRGALGHLRFRRRVLRRNSGVD